MIRFKLKRFILTSVEVTEKDCLRAINLIISTFYSINLYFNEDNQSCRVTASHKKCKRLCLESNFYVLFGLETGPAIAV